VHEPFEIFSLCLRKEQRIQDQALIFLAHVVHTAPRPGHMQRQLNLADSRSPQVFQRRRQAARIRAPARRQSISLQADNYPPSCTPRSAGMPRAVTRDGPPARGKSWESSTHKLFSQFNSYICECSRNLSCIR